jgi:hypothetical protein
MAGRRDFSPYRVTLTLVNQGDSGAGYKWRIRRKRKGNEGMLNEFFVLISLATCLQVI